MTRAKSRSDPSLRESLAAAYERCAEIAYSHYENFPVASWLLPAPMRPHIAAIYAFARTADDFADEPGRTPDERYRLLNEWNAKLHRSVDGHSTDPIFVALAHTMRERRLPLQLFEDLLSAFRQDVSVTRYETWDDVLDYCRRSANPVGRLVLRVAGVDDPAVDRASDALCTALQLTNFWQDFGVDWSRGRLYIPREEVVRAGAQESDLSAKQMTPAWKSALRACVVTTRALFEAGRPVTDAVTGRLRLELRATWFGGMRVLEKIEQLDFDTLNHRPTVGKRDVPALALRALVGKPV
jgi:hydroxysqualene synthase